MELSQQGSTFRLGSKHAVLAIDPSSADQKDDCILWSTQQDKKSAGDPLSFDGPGEYEVRNSLIDGVAFGDATGYIITFESIRVAFVPVSEQTDQLTEAQLEHYHDVDVLIVPVTEAKASYATKLISQLEPTIVVPYGANPDGLKQLQSEFGEHCSNEEKLRLTRKDLGEIARLVCLKG